jgi:ribosomal protein S18 acetylase RimI-like enzyme
MADLGQDGDVDGSYVRLALPRDVGAVAGVQARAWSTDYAELLPVVVLARLESSAAGQWAEAVERPPTSAHHLLVAVDHEVVAGMAVTSPADPDDGGPQGVGALMLLAIDPERRRAGHGSRLLAAVADTLRADGFTTAVCWLPAADEVQTAFLAAAGWALDGASRELDMGADTMRQVRLATVL